MRRSWYPPTSATPPVWKRAAATAPAPPSATSPAASRARRSRSSPLNRAAGSSPPYGACSGVTDVRTVRPQEKQRPPQGAAQAGALLRPGQADPRQDGGAQERAAAGDRQVLPCCGAG